MNKTQKEREEMREEFFKRFTYGGKTGIVAIEKSSFEVWNWIEKALSQKEEEVRREVLEEVKQLANNLKVNINSNVDTRTMEYKAYLQRKGHNGALKLLCDSLNELDISVKEEKGER